MLGCTTAVIKEEMGREASNIRDGLTDYLQFFSFDVAFMCSEMHDLK